jgi:hypothetical protein
MADVRERGVPYESLMLPTSLKRRRKHPLAHVRRVDSDDRNVMQAGWQLPVLVRPPLRPDGGREPTCSKVICPSRG